MNYLVTGATGFIGKHLVEHLLEHGDSVNYLARHRNSKMNSRAAFHCWSPGETPALESVPRLDAVVNLAGEPVAQRWNSEVKKRIYSSRVEGTRQLVSAIAGLKHKPAVLVSASAVGYYGDRGNEVLTETSAPGADFLATLCVDWEHEAMRARETGLRVVTVRIGVVLGRNAGALSKMLPPARIGLEATFGHGRQWMSWIHIEDMVRLLVFAAETASVSGPVNGSSPEPVRNAQFARVLARTLHAWSSPSIPLPKFVLKLGLGEVAEFFFNSSRVLPQAPVQAGFQFYFPQLQSALTDILG